MPVLASMGERESGWIRKTNWRSMHHFGDERERLQCSRAELFEQQQRCEIAKLPLVGNGQHRAEPSEIDVLLSDIVMSGSNQFPDLLQGAVRVLANSRQHRILGWFCM